MCLLADEVSGAQDSFVGGAMGSRDDGAHRNDTCYISSPLAAERMINSQHTSRRFHWWLLGRTVTHFGYVVWR